MPVEHVALDLHEIQSLSLAEVVEAKAREAYTVVQRLVLVEDVSLAFTALNGLPGPLIRWFLTTLGNEGMCRLLDGFPDRRALARVAFFLFDGSQPRTFLGERRGTVATEPRGEGGYGWDPIFIPEGFTKTWAEMTDDERRVTSMRKTALDILQNYLAGAKDGLKSTSVY